MPDFQQHQTHHAFPAAPNAPVSALDTSTGLDVREVVWLKLQVLKDEYLQDMKELYCILTLRSTMPMPPEQLQKLKHYQHVVQRMIPYLTVPKERMPVEFNEYRVEAFEKQVVNILQNFKRRVQQAGPVSQKQLHLREALQSVQQEHAQIKQQWQQQMLQLHEPFLQQRKYILQQRDVLQKHLLQQPGPLSQQQLEHREALQSVQRQHAQLHRQWWQQVLQQDPRLLQQQQQEQQFQQMMQRQQRLLQQQEQILQQQEVLQKYLLQQY